MTPQDMEAIRAKLEQQLLALANLWRGRAEWQQGAPGAEAQVGRCADDLVASLPGLLSSLTAAGEGADVRQVAAEMRHFGRLLRSRDVMPTPETMADRLTEWAEELFGAQPSPADGKAQEPADGA